MTKRYYVFSLQKDQELPKDGTRFIAVKVKDVKPLQEVPEITGTCVDTTELMKQARNGVRFFKVINE